MMTMTRIASTTAAAATAMVGATDNNQLLYLKEAAEETGGGGSCGGDDGSKDGGDNDDDDGNGDCRHLMDAMVKVCPCWLLTQGWKQVTNNLGGTCKRGGVWARNANYCYKKKGAPLEFGEACGKVTISLMNITISLMKG